MIMLVYQSGGRKLLSKVHDFTSSWKLAKFLALVHPVVGFNSNQMAVAYLQHMSASYCTFLVILPCLVTVVDQTYHSCVGVLTVPSLGNILCSSTMEDISSSNNRYYIISSAIGAYLKSLRGNQRLHQQSLLFGKLFVLLQPIILKVISHAWVFVGSIFSPRT